MYTCTPSRYNAFFANWSYHLNYSATEELLNTWTHIVGAVLALIGATLLLKSADSTMSIVAVTIYGFSLVLMFVASSFYHGAKSVQLKPILKMLDHSAIYTLIAGTYTPFMLLTLDNWLGVVGISVIWGLALAGLVFKWVAKHRFPKVSVTLYLLMGWLVIFYIVPLYNALPIGALWWLLAGGLFYSVGVAFYVAKQVRFTHAIWHVFVMAGSACHFVSIYAYVV